MRAITFRIFALATLHNIANAEGACGLHGEACGGHEDVGLLQVARGKKWSYEPVSHINVEPCPVDDEASSVPWSKFPTPVWKDLKPERQERMLDLSNLGDKPVQMIISTDLDNEVDDYFAVAWAMLRPDKLNITAIYSVPFSFRYRYIPFADAWNAQQVPECDRTEAENKSVADYSTTLQGAEINGYSAADMYSQDTQALWCPDRANKESYRSLKKFVKSFGKANSEMRRQAAIPVFKGSSRWLTGSGAPYKEHSPAVDNLIKQAMAHEGPEPLYVAAIGSPTNVANALLIEPKIKRKIVVLWGASWPVNQTARKGTGSVNAGQDPVATQVLFESGVPLFYFPGFPVTQALSVTRSDAEVWLKGRGVVSQKIFERYIHNPDMALYGTGTRTSIGQTRIQWDMAVFMPFILPGSVDSLVQHEPTLGDDGYWKPSDQGPWMREAILLQGLAGVVNPFTDLIAKLAFNGL